MTSPPIFGLPISMSGHLAFGSAQEYYISARFRHSESDQSISHGDGY